MVTPYRWPSQLGGGVDARFPIICARMVKAARAEMGLPTVRPLVDAQFGYDGVRHGQVLLQLHHCCARPRDWLLTHALLRRFTLHIRVPGGRGVSGVLASLRLPGGGMIQGLSGSGAMYSLLPVQLDLRLRAAAPAAAPVVNVPGGLPRRCLA